MIYEICIGLTNNNNLTQQVSLAEVLLTIRNPYKSVISIFGLDWVKLVKVWVKLVKVWLNWVWFG